MTWGIERSISSNALLARGSCRVRVAATYTVRAKPEVAGSSRAVMTRITPLSLRWRTRCSVAAGERPIERASSTLVTSASVWSSESR